MTRLAAMRPAFVRDHMWTRRHLSEYLDGELDQRSRGRVERHAGACPACRQLIATLKRTLEALHGLRHPPPGRPSGQVTESVIGRLRDST
jgi:anti-sigma factor RsiW